MVTKVVKANVKVKVERKTEIPIKNNFVFKVSAVCNKKVLTMF